MKKVWIVLLVVALLAVSVAGCKSQSQQMVEDAYGDSFKSAMAEEYDLGSEPNDDGLDEGYQNEAAGVDDGDGNGEEITVDTEDNSITLGGGEWPSDAPAEIPVFDKAEISSVVTTSNGAIVSFIDVGREDGAVYIQELMDSGWNLIAHTDDSDWETYSGQMGDVIVSVEWDLGDMYIVWEIV